MQKGRRLRSHAKYIPHFCIQYLRLVMPFAEFLPLRLRVARVAAAEREGRRAFLGGPSREREREREGEGKLARRPRASHSVTNVDRPLFSRPQTIFEPQGDRRWKSASSSSDCTTRSSYNSYCPLMTFPPLILTSKTFRVFSIARANLRFQIFS